MRKRPNAAAHRKDGPRRALWVGRVRLAGAHALVGLLMTSCRTAHHDGPAPTLGGPTTLDAAQIAELIPHRVADRRGWAEAISHALAANDLPRDVPSACAVIAMIAQESGFQADPVVPGLARIVAARVDRYKERLGFVGQPLFDRLLAGRAPDDARSFRTRLATVRTERDVDVLFRDILAYYEVNHPALFAAANVAGQLVDLEGLGELNPITTAGSMQVSVRFSVAWAATRKGSTATPTVVRDSLYTREGGVYYGTARLLAFPVAYEQAVFRFADYNAGFYASRNAALQAQLGRLVGVKLALDGDFLAYDRSGVATSQESNSSRAAQLFTQRYAPQISVRQLRHDLLTEKSLDFEATPTYRAIKQAFACVTGAPPPYAVLPDVAISSPKLARTRSTAWFAQAVDRRYQTCLAAASLDDR